MIRLIDRLSSVFAELAAWMFFAIGAMVTYEVVMRKVFGAPTIWVDEIARFFQVWAVYLAAAYILKARELIAVDVLSQVLPPSAQRLLDLFGLVVIAVFSAVAIWHGAGIVAESVEQGRATSTMLGTPKWITESAIPVGFALLLVQCLAEIVKVVTGAESKLSPGHTV